MSDHLIDDVRHSNCDSGLQRVLSSVLTATPSSQARAVMMHWVASRCKNYSKLVIKEEQFLVEYKNGEYAGRHRKLQSGIPRSNPSVNRSIVQNWNGFICTNNFFRRSYVVVEGLFFTRIAVNFMDKNHPDRPKQHWRWRSFSAAHQ